MILTSAAQAEVTPRPIPESPAPPVIETDAPDRYKQERPQIVAELSMMSPTITDKATQTELLAGGIPVGFAAFRYPFLRRGEWQTAVIAKVGFGANTVDTRRMQILPLVGSFEISRPIEGLPFLKPAIAVGAGSLYTVQESERMWTQFLNVRPSVLFMQNTSPGDWFGGFSFGLTRWWGIGPSRVSSWSVDTGIYFNL